MRPRPTEESIDRGRDPWRTWAGWLFVGPVLAGVAIFQVAPIFQSIAVSFTNWNGITPPDYVGVDNYVRMLTADPVFWTVLRNTVVFTFASVGLSIAVGLVLSLMLNSPIRGRGVFRTIFLVPLVSNMVAIGFVWFWIFQADGGLINGWLSVIGIDGPDWLLSRDWAMVVIVIVAVWQGIGYPIIILLAGLQAIPEELNEAASIDGASGWRRFWRITLPLLTPSLAFLTITQIIMSFQIFGIIYVMTRGGPGNATSVLIYHIYSTSFGDRQIGYASAMGMVLFIFVALITLTQVALQKRWVHVND